MEALLQQNKKSWFDLFSSVNQHQTGLLSLNSWWDKVALVGKINSLNVPQSLLSNMLETKAEFAELQEVLIDNLLSEQLQQCYSKNQALAQTLVDIPNRNLFERTADVGFLATDKALIDYLSAESRGQEMNLAIQERLHDYIAKYSVYDDILLFNPEGELLLRSYNNAVAEVEPDPIITQVLDDTQTYWEVCRYSPLFPDRPLSSLFLAPVKDSFSEQILGVLCLSFKLADEMATLFEDLDDHSGKILTLLDSKGDVIETSQPGQIPQGMRISLHQSHQITTINHRQYFVASARCRGYQGYFGLGWQGCILMPLNSAALDSANNDEKAVETERWQGFSPTLSDIQYRAKIVTEDLDLVVLNGRIAAARTEADEFIPILEEIRQIGRQMQGIFSSSVNELMSTALSTHLNGLQGQAALAVDIMDRNLYERANDCRWWAQTPAFMEYLKHPESANTESLTKLLSYINSLYTVYTGIYLYDRGGRVVAVSVPELNELLGNMVADNTGWKGTLTLNNSLQYCVSDYNPCDYYNAQQTYIYNAAVFDQHSVIGGIGLVFDSAPQFQQMLSDVLADSANLRTGLYIDQEGKVISNSPGSEWQVGDRIPLPHNMLNQPAGMQGAGIYKLGNKEYLIGYAVSKGYREYKNNDGYRNDVIALIIEPNKSPE